MTRRNKKGGVKPMFNPKGEPLFRCPFPNCGAIFAKEPGKPDACLRHRNLIGDVLFILDHLKKPEEVQQAEGSKLFIPKPGMSNKAIEEAKASAGRPPYRTGP